MCCLICPIFSAPLPLASSIFWGPRRRKLQGTDPNEYRLTKCGSGVGQRWGQWEPTCSPRAAGDVCIPRAQNQVSLSALSWQSPQADSGWRVRRKGKKLGEAGFWKAVKGLSSRWKTQKFGWGDIYCLTNPNTQEMISWRHESTSLNTGREVPDDISLRFQNLQATSGVTIKHMRQN